MSFHAVVSPAAAMKDVAGYLQSRSDEASAASDQALADLWADARDLHAKKLWHQLTGVLARLVDMPDKVDLTALYDNVVSECETKLQPLRLANLAVPIARAAKDLEAALKFLDRIGGKVKDHAEASALVKVTQANECLRREQKEQMQKVKVSSYSGRWWLEHVCVLMHLFVPGYA